MKRVIELTGDEALVVYDALARWDDADCPDSLKFENDGEKQAFSQLLGSLESLLAEPFSSEYGAMVDWARTRLREKYGPM